MPPVRQFQSCTVLRSRTACWSARIWAINGYMI
ncbi:hypothetical protein H206_05229 [Candidatus Electrothrix aarhusensis]|uniref:Uncharacterized protein n=1 Tax=Candidatus Electrothrix aarhusensis TaxID=1859131 RepID=A0A444J530_9BACT|nr:hypothetical protein H206_05229 [Candidatus Electrothrix aarhusensis]